MFQKTFKPFNKRSKLAAQAGKNLMALSVENAGKPSDNSKPPIMPAFVRTKIKESTQH